ncbi:MAG: hypothetical protein LLF94_00540 [Chlamydiales bacterium]|nr:hypothetical protein [Chlamydiales bacterium]
MSWFKTGWQPSAPEAALNRYVQEHSYRNEDPVHPVDPAVLAALHAPTPPQAQAPQPQTPTQTSTMKKTAMVGAAGVAGVIGVKVAENILHQKVVTPVVNAATEHGPGILASAGEAIGGAADTIYDATLGMIFGPWISSALGYTTPSFVKRITVGGVGLGAMYGIFLLYNSCRYPYGYPVVGGGGTQNNNVHISISQLPLGPFREFKNVEVQRNVPLKQEQKDIIKQRTIAFAKSAKPRILQIPQAIKVHARVTAIADKKLGLLSEDMAHEIVQLKERFDALKKRDWLHNRLPFNVGVAQLTLEAAEHELTNNEVRAKAVVQALTDRKMHAMHVESEKKVNDGQKEKRHSERIAAQSNKKRKFNKM